MFCGHLVRFRVIWYILSSFGISYFHLVYFISFGRFYFIWYILLSLGIFYFIWYILWSLCIGSQTPLIDAEYKRG
jgi:hypothetical protein